MPYEEGQAHYELGRHASGETRRHHLARAIALFARLGADHDLRQAIAAARQAPASTQNA